MVFSKAKLSNDFQNRRMVVTNRVYFLNNSIYGVVNALLNRNDFTWDGRVVKYRWGEAKSFAT